MNCPACNRPLSTFQEYGRPGYICPACDIRVFHGEKREPDSAKWVPSSGGTTDCAKTWITVQILP